MKKTLTVLAVISAAAAALSSCSQAVRTETMEVSEKFALADGRTDSLDLYISAEYPVSGLRKSAGLKISAALTGYLFGEEYIGMGVAGTHLCCLIAFNSNIEAYSPTDSLKAASLKVIHHAYSCHEHSHGEHEREDYPD